MPLAWPGRVGDTGGVTTTSVTSEATSVTPHPDPCRCQAHRTLQARRDACYRHLALAILGPDAPGGAAALACALSARAARA